MSRYIGDQDVFDLQERVIRSIVDADQTAAAKAVMAPAPDPVQLSVAEDVMNAMRRGGVDRGAAKTVLQFLEQALGKSLIARLKDLRHAWTSHGNDRQFIEGLSEMAAEYRKPKKARFPAPIERSDLRLVCFEYLSA